MSVTDSLSKRDRQLAEWFAREGFEHPVLTVAALRVADIKPQTAAAVLTKESGGGRNVFGCDWGKQGGKPPWCGEPVTEARYRALRKLGKANGVGPVQLTSPNLQDRADKLGGCWRPYPNMVVGFGHLGQLIRAHGVEAGAARYNGGDSHQGEENGAEYGRELARLRESFEGKLRKAGFHV